MNNINDNVISSGKWLHENVLFLIELQMKCNEILLKVKAAVSL